MINIPFINKKEEVKEYFLALLVKPFNVGAILFEEIDSKLLILSTHEVEQGKETIEETSEELVEASDKVISYVENSLPPNSKLEKTIFSVPYDWVEEGKIKKEYLAKLKKVCEELGLTPMGFIMSIEAIVHFLQKKEGAPISSIFVEVAKNIAFVYVVRNGKIIEVKKGEVKKDLLSTVEDLLRAVEKLDVLPSKIVLLDYEGVEGVQQDFLSHQWTGIPFLHIPQVVVLEKGFENEATVNGVAAQMGFEVLQDLKAPQMFSKNDEEGQEEKLEEKSDPEEFGFFKDKDVAEEPEVEKEPLVSVSEEPEEEVPVTEPKIEYYDNEKPRRSLVSVIQVKGVFASFNKILPTLRGISFKGFSFRKNGFILIGGAIAVIIAFLFVYYNFILKANVLIFADEKKVEKNQDIKFETSGGDSTSIKLNVLDQEVSGGKTKDATGKKETGDKAKGEIVIYNKTEQKKTFSKGTTIVGPNDLEFVLSDEANVASTSSFSTTLSSVKVKVEASKFGKEYNLPSSSNFTVKGISTSSFIAKNNDAFSGGTKKETNVVSKKDLDDLLSSIKDDLEKKGISSAQEKAGKDQIFLPKALSYEVIDKKYDKKDGDEAGSVTIDAKITFKFGTYNKNDLKKVVLALTKNDVPSDYELEDDKSKVEVSDIKIVKDSVSGKISVKGVFAPKIDSEKSVAALSGKTENSAKKTLEKISGVTEVQVIFKNRIPFLPAFLPFNKGNIKFEKKS